MAAGNHGAVETEMQASNLERGEERAEDLDQRRPDNDGGTQSRKWDLKEAWKACIWYGGSVYDAWINAVAAQVGSVILTLPYTLSQMGYGFGIGLQFLYGAFGCWTVYLLGIMYAEASARTRRTGLLHEKHILQYHEVIGIVAGKWLGRITFGFNMISLLFACVLQLIACSSDVYYMNSNWNKREWLYLFGFLAIPSILLPSLHNFRTVSLVGIATTTLTSAYMTTAAVQHGQIGDVRHQGPKSMVQFFSGATNILFSFGSHGLCIELMEAMWKPSNYKYAYVAAVMYTYLLTIPDSVSVYWAYGDVLLHNSNAFGVLPPSKMKNVAIVAMILHQYVAFMLNVNPLFLAWEKALGVHTSGKFALKAVVRVPLVVVIWLLALAVPFFGPINSVMGAFLVSFSVYIIPSVALMRAYFRRTFPEMQVEKLKWKWKIKLGISAFVAIWVFVIGFGCGGWASITNFSKQIHTFGLFEKCYQCPSK